MNGTQKHFEKQDRANELLRYAIRLLKPNPPVVATTKGIFEIVLALKRDLARMGAYWQVLRLENHIHKWQRSHWRDRQ